ncbi:MAG: hypothetical protein JXM70_23660 [Pirellulales bacterium]|nr:hypothetical protein [Pirellulales bacterium]
MDKKTDFSPPSHLSENSKKIWQTVVPATGRSLSRLALVQSGLESLDRANQARALIDAEGIIVNPEGGKMLHLHPAIRLEKESRAAFERAWKTLELFWDRPDLNVE